jgi:CBS domain-containing protein
MTSANLTVARAGDDLALVAQIMLWTNARHLPVLRDGRVVGVISARDLVRQPKEGDPHWPGLTVEDIMSQPAVTVDPDTPLPKATSTMLSHKIGCVPVVEGEVLVGMLTTTDLLRYQLDASVERPATHLPPTVRALMKPAPALVVPETEVFDAAALMGARGVRHLPVIDREQKVVGMVSDRDVRAALGDPRRFLDDPDAREQVRDKTVGEVMSKPVVTVRADWPISSAVERLVHDQIGALPVVDDDGKLVGVISYVDIIQALEDRL